MEAVIFDFDDVIAETQKIKFYAYSKVLESHGITLTEDDYVKDWNNTASGVRSVFEKNKNLNFENFRKESTEVYLDMLKTKLRPVEGAIEVLNKIKIKKGLASNSKEDHVAFCIDMLKIRDSFNVIVTGSDISKPKPDPEVFLTASNLLGVRAQNCLAVDDHWLGIRAAKAAGMKAAAIPHGYSHDQDFSEADYVLKNIRDVLKLLI